MSDDTAGTGRRTAPGAPATHGPGAPLVHEAYSFACMRCGHGWEQSYDIAHHRDATGRDHVVYTSGGHEVPSPLSRPACAHCGGHVVRIMRAGRVAAVLDSLHPATRVPPARPAGATRAPEPAGTPRHLWQVSGLLRLLHLRRTPTT
jgi:hypothetical protein